jgi:hypothetical protein
MQKALYFSMSMILSTWIPASLASSQNFAAGPVSSRFTTACKAMQFQ